VADGGNRNDQPRAEGHRTVDFSPWAEALGVRPDQVLGLHHARPDGALVFYAVRDEAGSTDVFSASVVRGRDGVLRPDSEPTVHPGLWEEIEADPGWRLRSQ
jgi:hypothetical protein